MSRLGTEDDDDIAALGEVANECRERKGIGKNYITHQDVAFVNCLLE